MAKRIAINCGGGYAPGLNAVVMGAVRAASRLRWDVVGIHDGFDGVLAPDRYQGGGKVALDLDLIARLDGGAGLLGTGARIDPFRVRRVSDQGFVEETDRSDDLIATLRRDGVDAVVSIVGGSAITGAHALSVAYKLSRKGLPIVCVPKSAENDIAATAMSLGASSALAYVIETLERLRAAARDVRRVAVVEVPGREAGWLALQAGLAVCADVVLIPEIAYDLAVVGATLRRAEAEGRRPCLVVVAEGAQPIAAHDNRPPSAMRRSLSPLAEPEYGEGAAVIERAGRACHDLAASIRAMTDLEAVPTPLNALARAGAPNAIDRQLGVGYGAAAIRALERGQTGVLVALQPPDLKVVPLSEAINRVRTVPRDGEFARIARAIGICLGDVDTGAHDVG